MPEVENRYEKDDIERVAVIGMAGRFPGAKNIAEYWHNIRNGVESIVEFTDEELRAYGVPEEWLKKPNFVKSGTVLTGVDQFDASFFGYSPTEVIKMDPQQRIFLEAAWEALENAGYDPDRTPGPVGVFAGSGINTYFTNNLGSRPDVLRMFGLFPAVLLNEKDFIATRVAYKMNLSGPALNVQTACSTSLVAVCNACTLSVRCQHCAVANAYPVAPVAPVHIVDAAHSRVCVGRGL